jgi:hypothetical protein
MPKPADHGIGFFDMTKLQPGGTFLIIGKRACGKTSLLYNLLYHMSKWFGTAESESTGFDCALAMAGSTPSANMFMRCLPRAFVRPPDIDRLQHFVGVMKAQFASANRRGTSPKNGIMMGDDLAYNTKLMKCNALLETFLNGRNYGITCLLVLQYIMKVGPDFRSNADYVFVFWDNNSKNQDKIHEFWFNMMPKDTFRDAFATCTRDYAVLVMDVRQSATSRDWHDCVFWYKAPEMGAQEPFRLCQRDMDLIADYCEIEDPEAQQMAAANAQIWRLGPNGEVYDEESPE